MAETAQLEIIKIVAFTVGTDIIRGIESIRYQIKAPGYHASRAEGAQYPDNLEPTYTDEPKVSGSVAGKSMDLTALVGVKGASATIAGVNARNGNACTITLTNPYFQDAGGSHAQLKPGEQSIQFVATDYAAAENV